MNVQGLLDKIEDTIDMGSKIPLSGKVAVDAETIKQCIEDIRYDLPIELEKAQEVVAHHNNLITKANNEASSIVSSAQTEADGIISAAKEKASGIAATARDTAIINVFKMVVAVSDFNVPSTPARMSDTANITTQMPSTR